MTASPVRVGLIAAWPVYYHAPLYRLVAGDSRVDFTAVFASSAGVRAFDRGFGKPTTWGDETLHGYRSIFLRSADVRRPGGFWSLRDVDIAAVLRRERFDVLMLHGYNSFTHLAASLVQRTLGGAVVYREEQTLLRPRSRWRRAAKYVPLRTLFAGASALYIGTENRRWFEHYGIPANKLFYSPYAVDNRFLQERSNGLSARRDELRAGFEIRRANDPVFVFVGRLIAQKRVDLLIEAFSRVRKHVMCTLLIVGSGPLESALRRFAAERDIPDVLFAGFATPERVHEAYAASDVFCMTSMSETWGIVVNEAMNFGLPLVLSSQVGSARDLVLAGETGYVVRTVDETVQAMKRLATDSELRLAMSERARAHVRAFSYEAAARGVAAAVSHVVGPGRWRAACGVGAEREQAR